MLPTQTRTATAGRALPDHQIGGRITAACHRNHGRQRSVVFKRPVVPGISDIKISEPIDCDMPRQADGRRTGTAKLIAARSGETGLAEDRMSSATDAWKDAGARGKRRGVFENTVVVEVGDIKIADYINSDSARLT